MKSPAAGGARAAFLPPPKTGNLNAARCFSKNYAEKAPKMRYFLLFVLFGRIIAAIYANIGAMRQ